MSFKSKRESGGFKSPLAKVTGHVDSVELEDTPFKDGQGNARQRVVITLSKLVVHASDVAYDLKTAQIGDINFSNSLTGGLAILEDSIGAALGLPIEDVYCELIVGKTVTLEREDNYVFFKRNNEEQKGRVWRVTGIEGAGPVQDPKVAALDLLAGKSWGEFVQVAVANSDVRRDVDLMNSIISGTFKQDPGIAERYTEANGIYTAK